MGNTRLVDARVLSGMLGCSEAAVYKWHRDGLIPSIRVGERLVRFDVGTVAAKLGVTVETLRGASPSVPEVSGAADQLEAELRRRVAEMSEGDSLEGDAFGELV